MPPEQGIESTDDELPRNLAGPAAGASRGGANKRGLRHREDLCTDPTRSLALRVFFDVSERRVELVERQRLPAVESSSEGMTRHHVELVESSDEVGQRLEVGRLSEHQLERVHERYYVILNAGRTNESPLSLELSEFPSHFADGCRNIRQAGRCVAVENGRRFLVELQDGGDLSDDRFVLQGRRHRRLHASERSHSGVEVRIGEGARCQLVHFSSTCEAADH